eukprot:TRINITY_DN637_c0_g2_i1.p1 TRINITY_DN637_c0_g2~~TRINITY_DN637_c0_g2_i1.p1  ORF type:complete len:562 (+),score=164.47 TRINITY_DN637_c0_g2_i1:181-1866(+)
MDFIVAFLGAVSTGSFTFTIWRSADSGWDPVTLVWELFLVLMFTAVSVAWISEKSCNKKSLHERVLGFDSVYEDEEMGQDYGAVADTEALRAIRFPITGAQVTQGAPEGVVTPVLEHPDGGMAQANADAFNSMEHSMEGATGDNFRGAKTAKSLHAKVIKSIGKSTTAGCAVNLMVTTHGQFVVGKKLTLSRDSRVALEKLTREAEILMRLSHPCVVAVFDAQFTSPSNSVIIEELGDRGTVRRLLDTCTFLPYSIIRSYGHQMVSAVAYIHAEGIVHRDIKAANVLLFANGDVKLSDFGEARVKTEPKNADLDVNEMHGSAPWMAPEVLKGTVPGDTACDIWSLACTFYEMRHGKPPWEDVWGKAASALDFILPLQACLAKEELPPAMDKFAPELKALLTRCFVYDPAERAVADELLDDPWFYLGADPQDTDWFQDGTGAMDHQLSESISTTHTLNADVSVRDRLLRHGPGLRPHQRMNTLNSTLLTMSSEFEVQGHHKDELEVTPHTLAMALRWLSLIRNPPPVSQLVFRGTVLTEEPDQEAKTSTPTESIMVKDAGGS